MNKHITSALLFLCVNFCLSAQVIIEENFDNPNTKLNIVGRGDVRIENGVLKTKDAYAVFGDSTLRNYRATFRARVPENAEQVQIWAGFRHHNRFDRYVLGLKGGLQNNIELFRMGYMGADELLAIEEYPFPEKNPFEKGQWNYFHIEVFDDKISVCINLLTFILFNYSDKNSEFAPSGGVTLGGGWIEAEFDDLKIEKINNISKWWDVGGCLIIQEGDKREQQVNAYRPKKINNLPNGRTEISLNGDWLFLPNPKLDAASLLLPDTIENIVIDYYKLKQGTYNYESFDENYEPIYKNTTDFHIMPVPNFWNPSRIWLHGETMNNGKFPKGVSDKYYWQESARCEAYTFDYRNTNSALYRQIVELPKGIENKVTELVFDAVSKMADVYVNGAKVASHIGMFGEIRVDVSKHLRAGKNTIDVLVTRLKNTNEAANTKPEMYQIARIGEGSNSSDSPPAPQRGEIAGAILGSSTTQLPPLGGGGAVAITNDILKNIAHGFFQGDPAGIWQPVRLIISDKIKVEDVFIKPALDGAAFEVTIKNHSNKKRTFDLQTLIKEARHCGLDPQSPEKRAEQEIAGQTRNDNGILWRSNPLGKISLNANEEKTFTYEIKNLSPKLWSPAEPNLYDFHFIIEKDTFTVVSGFRTFEAKNGLLYLNDRPYWLRAANHTPFALAPNDERLAEGFYKLMKEGNMQVTRTHTTPYNKLWIEKADEVGIGISHEGTYPWLMIHETMPDTSVIRLWADEYIALLKKYRNHPSILFWTINNEMKFYDNEPDFEKRKQKMYIIESVVKRIREIDPTRPISFDSNYRRREDIFGKDFYLPPSGGGGAAFDDGDIDDVHAYINWYDHTIFKYFNGEFQHHHLNEGRPLINQEMSTGYPNNETGHPTRFYTIVHQNPQTLIGYQAYPFGNPDRFLKTQAFITGELAEALRRTGDKSSGIFHFALLTWFRNVYDIDNIEPYPTYYAMKRAMQPVLVSVELWGRHFYAGEKLPVEIYIVNDKENGEDLKNVVLEWQIVGENIFDKKNTTIVESGFANIPIVKYYERYHFLPEIYLPDKFILSNISKEGCFEPFEPEGLKANAKLKLSLKENGNIISENEYDIEIANKEWVKCQRTNKKIVTHIEPGSEIDNALIMLGVKHANVMSIENALKAKADVLIFDNLRENDNLSAIRNYIAKGGKVIILNSEKAVKKLFPEYITGWITPTEGDIVNMEIPESPIFKDIDLLELRYFNNNKREIPTVCRAAYQINRHPNVEELANQTKIHGYVEGTMQQRVDYMRKIKGFPLLKITDGKGWAIISSMSLEKATTDPIAGKLLMNLINY